MTHTCPVLIIFGLGSANIFLIFFWVLEMKPWIHQFQSIFGLAGSDGHQNIDMVQNRVKMKIPITDFHMKDIMIASFMRKMIKI